MFLCVRKCGGKRCKRGFLFVEYFMLSISCGDVRWSVCVFLSSFSLCGCSY